MRNLMPRQVADLLSAKKSEADPGPLLLDVREPWEFDICRIDGSRSLPMNQIPVAVPHLEQDRDIICICHHGIRSYQVARFLEHQGFTRVINLEGGVAAWARDIDRSMRTY